MFVTQGPVDPESGLFVGRAAELSRMETWLRNVHCVGAVLGARQTGKTSLLLKLRHTLHEKYAFAFIDLQAVAGGGVDECFTYIAEEILGQISTVKDGEKPPPPKGSQGFMTFLEKFARASSAVRHIIILDEVGALASAAATKLAHTIRAVFTNRLVKAEYARYVFILAGATDMLELTVGRSSPLRNVTETIYLGDLAPGETQQLLSEVFGEARIRGCPEVYRHLHSWTEGHPYWTQLLAAQIESLLQGATEDSIASTVERLLQTEDKNLPHVFHSLQADETLWNMLEAVLEGTPLRFSRNNTAVAKLELIGVVKDREGHCAIRNRIYREAIQSRQTTVFQLWRPILSNLSQQMLASADLGSLSHLVADHLQQALHNRSVVVFLKGSYDAGYTAIGQVGFSGETLRKLRFEAGCKLLSIPELAFVPQEQNLPETEAASLQILKSALIVPIQLRGELIGFLSLGRKVSSKEYDTPEVEFLTAAAKHTAAGIDRIRLRDLQYDAERALEIQRRLLPREIQQIPGYQISGAWLPARVVSGDYYDVISFGGQKSGLCIGDVVGKGMAAALLVSNLQAQVRTIASEKIAPSELCERINRLLATYIESGKFITFFYAMLDAPAHRLIYTNAGHNRPFLLRSDGRVQQLEEGGPLLGVFPEWKYEQGEAELIAGDRLVLFTDGVSEARNAAGEEFGEELLVEVLKRNRSLDALELKNAVIKAVTEFSHGDFHDDVTLLVMAVL